MKVITEENRLQDQIRVLTDEVQKLTEQMEVLTTRIADFEPRSSVKPRSSDPSYLCSGTTIQNKQCKIVVKTANTFCKIHDPRINCCAGTTVKNRRCLHKVTFPYVFCEFHKYMDQK